MVIAIVHRRSRRQAELREEPAGSTAWSLDYAWAVGQYQGRQAGVESSCGLCLPRIVEPPNG